MPIQLSEQAERLAHAKAEQAGYADAGEYVSALLVDLEEEERAEQEDFLAAIREGLADVEAGRTYPIEVVFRDLATKYGIGMDDDELDKVSAHHIR